jgi:DNA replication protein DnaC
MMNTIKNIAKTAERAINEPTDYLNEVDNLMYCGKCHTPKQKRFDKPFLDEIDTVPIPCHCRALELEQEREEREQMEHFQKVKELRERGLKDKKMLEWNFKNDTTNSKQIDVAKRYVDNFDKAKAENTGLLLWGDVGTGKSFVAGCIANALIEKEIPVVMTNFAIILADMMNLKIDKNEYIKGLNRNSLLIIDDFGMERDTPFALEQIYNIIDSRYTASKPLIVTTNLNHAEMLKTDIQTDYRRIYDRVLEMCVPIYFEGESKRTQNAKQKLEKLKGILG